MIAIVDYGAGNTRSVLTALNYLGQYGTITNNPSEIQNAERVIFPGVGAVKEAMQNLQELGLSDTLQKVIHAGTPFLGICLGFQILFEESEEDGGTRCMGVLSGNVVHFTSGVHRNNKPPDGRSLKIPHMGWNGIRFEESARKHPVFQGIAEDSEFYFVHSFYPCPKPEDTFLSTEYGGWFAGSAGRGNVVATQFHPEKSGRPGLQMLENFCEWDGTRRSP